MKEITIFDLDGTLTESRSLIKIEMYQALIDLVVKAGQEIAVISGANYEQMLSQFPMLDKLYCNVKFHILPQSGNEYRYGGQIMWSEKVTKAERKEMLNHIKRIEGLIQPLTDHLLEDRGCQISYSLLGHDALLSKKQAFDPSGKIRLGLLEEHPLVSDIIEVRVAGTTCFDYTGKGRNKGNNIIKLAEFNGWDLEKCGYIGDAIYPGGNDETVIGVCDTIKTSGPEETLKIIKL